MKSSESTVSSENTQDNTHNSMSRMRLVVFTALSTAFIIVMGQIPPIAIPFSPVPLILQNMGIMIIASILGRRSAYAVFLFVLLAFIGLPVLSGGRGGIGVFLGPSAGFILAFPLAATCTGYFIEKSWRHSTFLLFFLYNILGMIVLLYMAGISALIFISGISIKEGFIAMLIFMVADIPKAAVAATIGVQFKRYYPLITVQEDKSTDVADNT